MTTGAGVIRDPALPVLPLAGPLCTAAQRPAGGGCLSTQALRIGPRGKSIQIPISRLQDAATGGPIMLDPLLIARAAVAIALSVLVAKAWTWCRRIYLLSRIPGPKGEVLGGQMKHFSQRSDHHKALQRWAAEFGGLYRIRLVDTTVRLGTRRVADPCQRGSSTDALCADDSGVRPAVGGHCAGARHRGGEERRGSLLAPGHCAPC